MSLLPSGYEPCTYPQFLHQASGFSSHNSWSFVGEQVRSAARYPQYSDPQARFHSFNGWPHPTSPDPFALSLAGFFHTGNDDCTRCFHCGIGLRNWLPPDIPFVEHARWAPTCEFVRERKGDVFVDNVERDYPREYPDEDVVDAVPNPAKDYNDIVQRVLEMPCGISIKEMFSQTIAVGAITKVLSLHEWDESSLTTEELANAAIDLQAAQENGLLESAISKVVTKPDSSSSELAQGSSSDKECLLEENRRLKDQMICKVCHGNEVSSVFLPCGHLLTCSDCAASVPVCFLCGKGVATALKVYV